MVQKHTSKIDDIHIVSLAERPELGRRYPVLDIQWPKFVHYDPTGVFYGLPGFAAFTLYALSADPDVPVGRARSVPLSLFHRSEKSLSELPNDGVNEVVRWAAHDQITGRRPDAVATVEITVRSDAQRQGIGTALIKALRKNARRLGFDTLVAPVRPLGKQAEPHIPMVEYIARRRDDGLPADPWLRAHVGVGGEITGVAPYSMTVPGTLEQWRHWTGLPFDRSGPTIVPGALVPIITDLNHDYAVYVEPNVWIHHQL